MLLMLLDFNVEAMMSSYIYQRQKITFKSYSLYKIKKE